MEGPARLPSALPLWIAIGLTVLAGGVGLLTDQLARGQGWSFPSTGYFVGEVIWKLATLALLVWAMRRVTQEPVNAETLGVRSSSGRARPPYPVLSAVLVAVAAAVVSRLFGASPASGSAYGHVHHVGVALALAELVVRYPLTVVAEETMFRGWMQPRLGRNGPVLSALLWSGYHLQQTSTLPTLVLLGLVLGLLRWWTGNVRLSAAVHYVSDAAFFVSTYL